MLNPCLIYLSSYINTVFLNKLRSSYYRKYDNDIEFILLPRYLSKLAVDYSYIYNIVKFIILLFLPIVFFIKTTMSALKFFLICMFHRKKNFNSSRLFLYMSHAVVKTSKRVNLFLDSDSLLVFPSTSNNEVPKQQQFLVQDFLNLCDVWNSYYTAIKVFFIVILRFGYTKSFYSLDAFNWFLLYNTLLNIPLNVELYMSNQKDRWAFLVDKLPHKNKIIVQHGSNYLKRTPNDYSKKYYKYCFDDDLYTIVMPMRLSNITMIYSFTEFEAKYMLMGEVKNQPIIKVIGYNLQLVNMFSDKYKILLIGNYVENAKIEEQLIKLLNNKSMKLYLKSHPLVDKSKYNYLKSDFDFEIVSDDCYPRVDIVFSYSSTLASEYESYGIRVVYFVDLLNEGIVDANKLDIALESELLSIK